MTVTVSASQRELAADRERTIIAGTQMDLLNAVWDERNQGTDNRLMNTQQNHAGRTP